MKFKNVGADVHADRLPHLGGPLVKAGDELEVAGEVVKPLTKKQATDAGYEDAPEGQQYMQVDTRRDDKGKEHPVYELMPDDAIYVQTEAGLRAYAKAQWEPVAAQKAGEKDKDPATS